MQRLLKVTLIVISSVAGYLVYLFMTSGNSLLANLDASDRNNLMLVMVLCGALVGILLAILGSGLVKGLSRKIHDAMSVVSLYDFFIAAIGAILGLVAANLVVLPISDIPFAGSYISLALNLLSGLLGMIIAISLKDDINERMRGTISGGGPGKYGGYRAYSRIGSKILDTSSLIDGRVLDIARSGFLDGTLIVPEFILNELQKVADSSDQFKRARGRRGLDVLKRMQDDASIDLRIMPFPQEDQETDASLIKMSRSLSAAVVTTDYNLNKAATLQGSLVLNVNELSNAVKPMVLPGEEMRVMVIKEGKEHGQGVGYLDDGTMIVVEGAKKMIGHELSVTVTSVLQTSAGRMIFTKLKEGMSSNGS
ncbi:MAG TPA: TRAM domain-containing protein [Bacillota bacterium]|nr:TRAM domain-containing protein [Bacillota bacterium]